MYDGMDRDLVQDFLNDEYLVMTMAGAPSHDDMLDCLANIENRDCSRWGDGRPARRRAATF